MKNVWSILDTLPQGHFCIDRKYKILYWNMMLENWTGKSAEQVTDRDIRDIFPELNKRFYSLIIQQVFEMGTTAVFSYQLHKKLFPISHKNGQNLCIQSQVVRADLNNDQTAAVFSLQDISNLNNQIKQNKEAKDRIQALLDEKKQTEEDLRLANEELQRAASTDPLTGLANRRSMMRFLDREVERFKRYSSVFSLLITDIDNFKSYNDRYGHACGDFILSEVGRIFRENLRPMDVVCRWGGEEFLFLLPEIDLEKAVATAERIRKHIEGHDFDHNNKTHSVTLTFGACSYDTVISLSSLINQADEALYEGKRNGKNRVVPFKA